jgi:hypothetical protein
MKYVNDDVVCRVSNPETTRMDDLKAMMIRQFPSLQKTVAEGKKDILLRIRYDSEKKTDMKPSEERVREVLMGELDDATFVAVLQNKPNAEKSKLPMPKAEEGEMAENDNGNGSDHDHEEPPPPKEVEPDAEGGAEVKQPQIEKPKPDVDNVPIVTESIFVNVHGQGKPKPSKKRAQVNTGWKLDEIRSAMKKRFKPSKDAFPLRYEGAELTDANLQAFLKRTASGDKPALDLIDT